MRSLFTVLALVPTKGHQQWKAPSSWAHQLWALNLGLQSSYMETVSSSPGRTANSLNNCMMGMSPHFTQWETEAPRRK